MNLATELYVEQVARWPSEGSHILVRHDAETIVVYRAYRPSAGAYAIWHGVFGAHFSYARMSWIKPNFLWMLVEPLHGLTFALFHLAGMRVIGATVPRHLAATAQAVYGTVATGAATAVLTLASGFLYTWLEGRAFFAMAALCAVAMALAARMTR